GGRSGRLDGEIDGERRCERIQQALTFERIVDGALRLLYELGIDCAEVTRHKRGLRFERDVGYDLVDDPEFARTLDRQPVFTKKDNFLRDLRTDEPGQQHHDDACAELQFGVAKERRIARNGHLAGNAQLELVG